MLTGEKFYLMALWSLIPGRNLCKLKFEIWSYDGNATFFHTDIPLRLRVHQGTDVADCVVRLVPFESTLERCFMITYPIPLPLLYYKESFPFSSLAVTCFMSIILFLSLDDSLPYRD